MNLRRRIETLELASVRTETPRLFIALQGCSDADVVGMQVYGVRYDRKADESVEELKQRALRDAPKGAPLVAGFYLYE